MRQGQGFGRAIVHMINALEAYAITYRAEFDDNPIGADYVLGDDGWLEALRGVRVLLNGELGDLDAGELDRRICNLARSHGYDESDGF